MRGTVSFRVSLECPEGASTAALRDYIEDAVRSMSGCLLPEDPLSDLDRGTVRVTQLRNPRRAAARRGAAVEATRLEGEKS
jgi:hypothetical protein